jgi:hypothetical protein
MQPLISRLWNGELGLGRTFWEFTILYGSLANLLTTLAALAALAADLPVVLVIALFLLPLPYNILVVVAVWRSAARYQGDRTWATLARLAVLVWVVMATLL